MLYNKQQNENRTLKHTETQDRHYMLYIFIRILTWSFATDTESLLNLIDLLVLAVLPLDTHIFGVLFFKSQNGTFAMSAQALFNALLRHFLCMATLISDSLATAKISGLHRFLNKCGTQQQIDVWVQKDCKVNEFDNKQYLSADTYLLTRLVTL